LVVECGCVRTPISTRDAASFQLTSDTTFEYSSKLTGNFQVKKRSMRKAPNIFMLEGLNSEKKKPN